MLFSCYVTWDKLLYISGCQKEDFEVSQNREEREVSSGLAFHLGISQYVTGLLAKIEGQSMHAYLSK